MIGFLRTYWVLIVLALAIVAAGAATAGRNNACTIPTPAGNTAPAPCPTDE
jgi:hypothetical protein